MYHFNLNIYRSTPTETKISTQENLENCTFVASRYPSPARQQLMLPVLDAFGPRQHWHKELTHWKQLRSRLWQVPYNDQFDYRMSSPTVRAEIQRAFYSEEPPASHTFGSCNFIPVPTKYSGRVCRYSYQRTGWIKENIFFLSSRRPPVHWLKTNSRSDVDSIITATASDKSFLVTVLRSKLHFTNGSTP